MDISTYIQRLSLPSGFNPSTLLDHGDLVAVPLARIHILEDLSAVNSSVAIIRQTRGGHWPDGPLTHDFNFLDLAWHEREFRQRRSFAYAVKDRSAQGEYIGCFYLNPLGSRVPLSEPLIELYDVDVSWWVTTAAFERGCYVLLFEAIKEWLNTRFPFSRPLFSNKIIPKEINQTDEFEDVSDI